MKLSGYIYKASAGETADSIARAVYGDEKYAEDLICANPEMSGKIAMRGGEEWLLPQIELPTRTQMVIPQTAPWKER